MAQTVPVKLSKFDNQPWGFRIQGGKDFSTPITVQKVNGGSLAERAGLNAGDTILSINGIDALKLRHKEAQDTLVKAGNNFEIVVVRGNVWKPAVTPLAEPKPQQNGETLLTKTSLAASQQAPPVNGAAGQQYNSPVGLYSEESIAETLTAQAEVLAQGVLGVNFKKNERQYNSAQSEVFKMLQEIDSSPKVPEAGVAQNVAPTAPKVHKVQNVPVAAHQPRITAGQLAVKHVAQPAAPRPKPAHDGPVDGPRCDDCERVLVGVFVKIKDRNLHVECFKCATCGTSLKNVGYYNISGKLYCDIHARQAARHNPPVENTEHITTESSSPVPPQLEKIRPRAQAAAQLQAAAALSREPKTPPVGGVRMFPGVLFEGGVPEKAQPPTPKPRVEVPKPEPIEPPQPQPVPEPVAQPIEEPAVEAVQPEVPAEPEPQSSDVIAEPAPQEVEAQPAPEPEAALEPAPVEQVPETVEQPSETVEPEPVAVEVPEVVEPEVLEAAPVPAPAPAPAPVPEPIAPVFQPAPSPVPAAVPQIRAPAFNPVSAPKSGLQERPLSGDYKAFIPRPVSGVRFMWPPAKNPETDPGATATPLYFSPGTRTDSVLDASHSQIVESVLQKSSYESFSSMSQTTVQTTSQTTSFNGHSEIKTVAPVVVPLPVLQPAYVSPVNQQPLPPVVKSVPAPVAKPAAPVTNPVAPPAIKPLPTVAPAPLPKPVNPPVVAPAAAMFSSAPAAPVVAAPNFTAPYMPAPEASPLVGASGQTTSAPKRGRGVLSQNVAPGARVPVCSACEKQIRGPFVTALGRNWCPEHFVCANESCKRHLQDTGFVQEKNELYCESCFESYLAPVCDKCQKRVVGDCLKAIGKQFHPECFSCAYCGRLFGNSRFYLEDGLPYCEADWNELFTTKCFGCGFPIEAGDRWVEAMNNNYHSQCFNCSVCKKNLEGQSFLAKGGKPMCKSHAARI